MTVARIETFAKLNYMEIAYDGIPSLLSQAPVTTNDPEQAAAIQSLGWRVIVHQDRAESLSPILAQTRRTILLVLAIAAVVTGIAMGTSQLLTGPITRLTTVAQKVTGGDLAVQASVETGDEIGTLAQTFNTMTAQLRDLIASLETRVQARTAQ